MYCTTQLYFFQDLSSKKLVKERVPIDLNLLFLKVFFPSRRNSMPGAIPRFLNPRQSIHSEPDSCPETLENLIRVTQQEKSVIQTYYTDDNGDVITLSVYDISETDPSDILGQDILEQEIPKFFDNDSEDAYDNVPLDFDVLQTRLERERRRRGSGQRSGDSFFEQRSSGDSYVEQ